MQTKLLAALFGLTLAALTAVADVRVETTEGNFSGTLTAFGEDSLTLLIGGKPREFALGDVVAIGFAGTPQATRATSLELAGGDRYFGTIVGGDLNEVELDTQSCGRIKIPGGLLNRIQFPRDAKAKPIKISDHPDKDVIYLKNGDFVTGRLEDMSKRKGGGFEFSIGTGNDEKESIASDRIYRVKLQPYDTPKTTTGFHAVIDCWDGARLAVQLKGFDKRILRTVTVADGVERLVPLAAISSIMFKNGGFVYLTDLEPSENVHTPYFSYKFPARFDRCRRGTPLTLRGRVYAKGIGMQSRTKITYDVDKGYREFRCLVGIDDLAGDGGSVVFRVYVNGKKVKETKVLRGGADPVAIRVPLETPAKLSLEADYADNAHVNDLADWVNPVLLKSKK